MRLLTPSPRLLPLIILLASVGYVPSALAKGTTIFSASFNSRKDLSSWTSATSGKARLKRSHGNRALYISAHDSRGTMIQLQLPVASLRGTQVALSYRVKGSDITDPLQAWNGIKVMLHVKGQGADIWPQQSLPHGSFPWMQGGFSASIPADADSAWLILGLESVSGSVWIDDIDLSVVRPARTRPTQPIKLPTLPSLQPLPKGMRGAMVSTIVTAEDLRVLASWGANIVRWQLTWDGIPRSPADTATPAQYTAWLQRSLTHLDSLLPLCHQLGLHIALDLHSTPGGSSDPSGDCRIFQKSLWQQSLITTWKDIATRYLNEPTIWGYDLVNEPQEGLVPDNLMDWPDLATRIAKDIRLIDTTHWIIMEAAPGGTPVSLAVMEHILVPGVVYSIHMYEPARFTLQNISSTSEEISYPGIIGGKLWNKDSLRRYLQPVRDWQHDYNAHIYVGEFSAIRWAPGESAYNYLRDCIEIFEDWNWDWTYHAFREWHGWSVEHSNKKGDEQPSITPNSRELLLKSYFRKNKPQ
jgi:endoglucanase